MSKNRALGIIGTALSVIVVIATSMLPASNLEGDPGPALYPYFMSGLLFIASVASFFQKQNPDEKPFMTKAQLKRMFLLFALFIGFAVCINLIGFYASVPVMCLSLCFLFSKGKNLAWYKMVIFTIIVTVLIYILFRYILILALPKGILF